ncbi:MAG: LysE/ArgO family amino acid transporter [Rhodoferax sp.]
MSAAAVFFSGFLAGLGLIVAIGAQNAFVLRQGLLRQHVGAVVAFCALSDATLIASGIAGLGVLLVQHPLALQVARWGGVAFLAAYGLRAAARAWRGGQGLDAGLAPAPPLGAALLSCAGFTWLNPHVYLDTVLLLGTLAHQPPVHAPWLFGLGAMSASVAWFSALGWGARWLRPWFARPQAWRVLDAAVALILWGLAATLATGSVGLPATHAG